MDPTTGKSGPEWPVVVGAYAVLFLLGAVEAMIGSFQYSRVPKPVPVAALVCCATILLTCVLGAWAMRSVSGALLPGMGWVITSFVLSMPVSNGSVIITATTPGKWYLYGGTLSVAAAVVVAFAAMAFGPRPRPRLPAPPRRGLRSRRQPDVAALLDELQHLGVLEEAVMLDGEGVQRREPVGIDVGRLAQRLGVGERLGRGAEEQFFLDLGAGRYGNCGSASSCTPEKSAMTLTDVSVRRWISRSACSTPPGSRKCSARRPGR